MTVPVGYQNWRRLLFLHWPIAVADIQPLIPACLEIDTYDGSAFIGLVSFVVEAARPTGAPPTLGLRFLETNVRTYVRTPSGEHGVLFFSLDAASLLAVVGARLALGLPYFWAGGRESLSERSVDYTLRRRTGSRVRMRYQVTDPVGIAAAGTLDHFLIERYRLHQPRGRFLWTVQVAHQPYPLYRAHLEALEDELVRAAGISVSGAPPLVHFASGVDVQVFGPRIRLLRGKH